MSNFPIGTRVELHPRLDAWMMGDRFGVVVGRPVRLYADSVIRVKMDRSGKILKIHAEDLTAI